MVDVAGAHHKGVYGIARVNPLMLFDRLWGAPVIETTVATKLPIDECNFALLQRDRRGGPLFPYCICNGDPLWSHAFPYGPAAYHERP